MKRIKYAFSCGFLAPSLANRFYKKTWSILLASVYFFTLGTMFSFFDYSTS